VEPEVASDIMRRRAGKSVSQGKKKPISLFELESDDLLPG